MDVDNDKRVDRDLLHLGERRANQFDQIDELFLEFFEVDFGVHFFVRLFDGLLDFLGPDNLRSIEHALTGVRYDPLLSWPLLVIHD